MGFSSENWMVSGIPLRGALKPIYTGGAVDAESGDEATTTTPTFEGSRIPSKLPCPPPPRKPRAVPVAANNSSNRCKYPNAKKEFFVTPPDLEAVFIRRHVGC